MTWSDQAQSMMKIWSEAQRTMWQGWYDAVQTASKPAMFNPAVVDEWRKLANQSLEMWTSGSNQFTKAVSGQFLASQAAMLQLLQFTANTWQAVAPRLDAGEDWQTVVTSYVEQMRQQMLPNTKVFAQTAQDTAELWRMYLEQLQAVSQPWLGVTQQLPALLGGAMTGVGNGSSNLVELTRLFWGAYDQTFGNLTQSPGFGFTRELEKKASNAFASWQEMQQAGNEYQVVLADGWSGVFREVLQEIKDRIDQGKPIDSLRGLMRLWIDAADRSFDKVLRSDAYREAQGKFVNAYMIYRINEQKLFEELMKTSYIPTRSEVDEAHRNIYELRREVRALRKAVRDLQKTETPA